MHATGTEGAQAVSLLEMLMRFVMIASTVRTPVVLNRAGFAGNWVLSEELVSRCP